MRFFENVQESLRFTGATLLSPFSRWIVFFLLGVPWLLISYTVDWTKIIAGLSIRWELIPWVVIPLVILGITGSFILAGYTVRLFRGGAAPPGFDYPGDLILDGIKLSVIGVIWSLPLFLMVGVIYLLYRVVSPSMFGIFMMILFYIFIILFILFFVFMNLVFGTIGVIRFARTGSVREAFAFLAISSSISRIGILYYIFSLVFLIIAGFLFTLAMLLFSLVPVAGPAIASFLSPVMMVFRCRFLTNVYDHVGTGAQPPAAPVEYQRATRTSGNGFLTWGLILIVLLALCVTPFFLMFGASGLALPAMTVEELEQLEEDDISIYSKEGYFSSPFFDKGGNRIIYVATTRPETKPADREFGSYDWENDIWVMSRDGTDQSRVTRIGDIREFSLDPVADRIAFDRYENGTNAVHILANTNAVPEKIPGPLPYMYFSSWSTDGTRFAATGYDLADYHGWSVMPDGQRAPAAGTEWSTMYIMNADGSQPQKVGTVSSGSYTLRTGSSWSPDGLKLVMPLYQPGEPGLGVADLATESTLRITRGVDGYPRWSPAGDQIAFIRQGDVWTVGPDGSREAKIATDGSVETLAWSRDGSRLAFSADSYLGIIDTDGTNLSRVSNIRPGPLSWSPNGQTLAYAPGMGARIRVMSLTPGVLKMGEHMANQMDRYKENYPVSP